MKRLVILSSFFVATPLFIFVVIAYLSFLVFQSHNGKSLNAKNTGVAYAALPPESSEIENTPESADARTEIVRQFFAQYHSPLETYAPDVVASADRWGLDYRLLPAIAMQESNLCRRVIKDSNNCWGFGIHGGKVMRFDNYPEAIETISQTLSVKYKAQGLVTPAEIAQLYNPTNTNNWVENVTGFMTDLK